MSTCARLACADKALLRACGACPCAHTRLYMRARATWDNLGCHVGFTGAMAFAEVLDKLPGLQMLDFTTPEKRADVITGNRRQELANAFDKHHFSTARKNAVFVGSLWRRRLAPRRGEGPRQAWAQGSSSLESVPEGESRRLSLD